MICILKMIDGKITGWIIATDCRDARRQAQGAGEQELAAKLYRMEFTPQPGKYTLNTGHIMLVSSYPRNADFKRGFVYG